MKRTKYTIVAAALLATMLMVAGCGNPLNQQMTPGAEQEGSLALTLSVPNYQSHEAGSDGSRIISPDTRFIEVFLYDGATRPTEATWGSTLGWSHGSAANGFFYTVYEDQFFAEAKGYEHLDVVLYDGNLWEGSGTEITSGSIGPVTVNAGQENEFNVTLTPPVGMFTDLTVDGTAPTASVGGGSMVFFRFDANVSTSYDISIADPGGGGDYGKPDVYVFDPDGRRPGTILATVDNSYTGDYLQTEGDDLTFTTYKTAQAGTYYIGVYGWIDESAGTDGSSDFEISVATAPSAIDRPAEPGAPPTGSVAWYIDEGIADLKDQRYNDALSDFTAALLVTDAEDDPEYGVALAGYNALHLMTGLTEPAVVDVARNHLGFADYPTDMSVLLKGEWLQRFVDEDGLEVIFPRVQGQSDVNGDGYVDMYDRVMAMVDFFVSNNAGFADVADPALNVLGGRVQDSISQIRAMGADQIMTFTWDMVYDDLDEIVNWFHFNENYGEYEVGYGWLMDNHRNPIDIVIGKAELLVLAAYGEMVKSWIHLMQVVDANLTQTLLQEYWATYHPENGTSMDEPPTFTGASPFTTDFLTASDDWVTQIDAARTAFLNALDDLEAAMYDMKSGRPTETEPLFVSPRSTLDMVADGWTEFESMMSLAVEEVIWRIEESIDDAEGDQFFYFPLNLAMGNASPEDYRYGNWPITMDLDTDPTVGLNFGRMFNAPMSNLLELDSAGEPAWYQADTGPFGFSIVTTMTDPDTFAQNTGPVFMRIPDATLGGLIPLDDTSLMPVDDPATQYHLDIDFSDMNGNDLWDPGEAISFVSYGPGLEGIVNARLINVAADYPNGDPVSYYFDLPDFSTELPDQAFVDAGYLADTTNAADLRTAIDNSGNAYLSYTPWLPGVVGDAPLVILQGNSIYVPVVPDIAWCSFASSGTSGTSAISGNQIHSTGTAWTSVLYFTEISGAWH